MSEIFIIDKKKAINNFDNIMKLQYGDKEESDNAFERLKEINDWCSLDCDPFIISPEYCKGQKCKANKPMNDDKK